jgi:hypothetical protein
MKTLVRSALLISMAVLAAPAFAGKPILNIDNAPVTAASGKAPPLEAVQKAILVSLAAKGWTGTVVKPGDIKANITVRTHTAEIEIAYDTAHYSIKYVNSTNLDYDAGKGTIHRNYNNWIKGLGDLINAEFLRSLP